MIKGSASVKELAYDPGFTWELFLITLLVLSFLSAFAAFLILIANGENPGLLITGIALILTVLTLLLTPRLSNKYRARQRLIIQRADEVIKNDARPPVLYLRSFFDDKMLARAIGFKSIEQEMKLVLFDIGPFIAFAEPNNEPPTDPGAARMYASQEEWKEKARKEMLKAQLVIIRIGDSPSFWWEVEEAIKIKVRPERLVFLIPPEKMEVRYEGFRQRASKWLSYQLPEYKRRWSPNGPPGGILYFEPDGTPHIREFKIIWFRQTFWNLFAASLKFALKPVYEQLGVEWRKPPVQLMQVLYMLVLFLLAMLVVYYLYAMLTRLI
ncbi:MAG TPA: hypothetical protein VE980_04275 [Pyrinomonadaceae bacterium]|nr:hypothetical protein [Pyrinomonadaceae bacterium]